MALRYEVRTITNVGTGINGLDSEPTAAFQDSIAANHFVRWEHEREGRDQRPYAVVDTELSIIEWGDDPADTTYRDDVQVWRHQRELVTDFDGNRI